MTLKDFPTKLLTVAKAKVDRMPHLPLTLGYNGHSLKVEGLLDTGASVNVFVCFFRARSEFEIRPKRVD